MTLQTHQFPYGSDNYGLLLHCQDTGQTACVDAGDSAATRRPLPKPDGPSRIFLSPIIMPITQMGWPRLNQPITPPFLAQKLIVLSAIYTTRNWAMGIILNLPGGALMFWPPPAIRLI